MKKDYSKAKIYKIVNDTDDKVYVGATLSSLQKRLYQHVHQSLKFPDHPLYKHYSSRDRNWKGVQMVLLESYPCASAKDLNLKLDEWITKLKPNIPPGSLRAGRRVREKKFRCHLCEIKVDNKYNLERHKSSKRHKMLVELADPEYVVD